MCEKHCCISNLIWFWAIVYTTLQIQQYIFNIYEAHIQNRVIASTGITNPTDILIWLHYIYFTSWSFHALLMLWVLNPFSIPMANNASQRLFSPLLNTTQLQIYLKWTQNIPLFTLNPCCNLNIAKLRKCLRTPTPTAASPMNDSTKIT